MPQNWKTYKLGNLCSDISYGYTESASVNEIGPKFLRITDIQNDFIDWSSVPYCKISDRDLIKYQLQVGDIVIARTGNSTGATAIIKNAINAVYASYLIRYQLDQELALPSFIDFALRSNSWKNFVDAIKGGSAQPGANAKQFAEFEILLPTLPEQKSIASILSALDDKIELNLATNRTLEQMAMALYKHWFVDFGPFQGGNFIESELGLIPEGWEVKRFGEFALNRRANRSVEQIAADDRYIGLEHLERDSLSILTSGTGDEVASNKSAFEKGDILFGKLRPYFKKVGVAPFDGVCSTDILVIQPKKKTDFGFVLLSIFNDRFIDYTTTVSGGTRMPRVGWNDIENYKVIAQNTGELSSQFTELVNVYVSQILVNVTENQTLTTLRDTLLPKLISGAVRVKDAERTVAHAL